MISVRQLKSCVRICSHTIILVYVREQSTASLCTQECVWPFSVHTTGFVIYRRVHNKILRTQEYNTQFIVGVVKHSLSVLDIPITL